MLTSPVEDASSVAQEAPRDNTACTKLSVVPAPGVPAPRSNMQVLAPLNTATRAETIFATTTIACPSVDGGQELTWVKTIGG